VKPRSYLVVLAALGVAATVPQDPVPTPATLQRAHRLAQPDAHHARLQRLVGDWDVVLRTTLPGGDPREDRGTVKVAAVLGGRYVVANYALQVRGAKVEAVQILGFDTLRQLYTSSWRDDASTWAIDTAGPHDAERPDLLTLTGSMVDAQDPTGRPCRLVVDLRRADAVAMRSFDTIGGKEVDLQQQQWTPR
jgi:hypothetical protein